MGDATEMSKRRNGYQQVETGRRVSVTLGRLEDLKLHCLFFRSPT